MKYENTRIVFFKEDYCIKTRDGGKKVHYHKGTRHAIHKGVVSLLKERGAKMDVSELDVKAVEDRLKEKLEKRRERQIKMSQK